MYDKTSQDDRARWDEMKRKKKKCEVYIQVYIKKSAIATSNVWPAQQHYQMLVRQI